MKTITIALGILACLAFLFAVISNAMLAWVYRGEPDTNGDPERDGCPVFPDSSDDTNK